MKISGKLTFHRGEGKQVMNSKQLLLFQQRKPNPVQEYLTLPETNIAPENGWLQVGILLSYWGGLFLGAMLVSGRVLWPF